MTNLSSMQTLNGHRRRGCVQLRRHVPIAVRSPTANLDAGVDRLVVEGMGGGGRMVGG